MADTLLRLDDYLVSNRPLNLTPGGLLPLQRQIVGVDDANVVHAAGSWRGGKSAGFILRLMLHSKTRAGGNYIIAGPSRDQALRIANQYIYQVGNYLGVPVAQHGWTWRVGQSTWHIFGASDKRAPGRMAGMTADGAFVTEISEISIDFYAMVLSRCSKPGRLVLTDCNPQNPYHWVNQELIGKKDETGDIVLERAKRGVEDNFYLGEDYVKEMRKRLPPHLIKRGLEGEWVVAEGLVYPDFETRLLMPTKLPPVVGVDYGWGKGGVTAAVAVYHYPGNILQPHGYYGAREEYYVVGPENPNIHAERLLAKWPNARFVTDPAPPPLYEALRARVPGRVLKARKGDGSILRGVNHLNAMFMARTMIIGLGLPNLTRELYNYVWSTVLAPVTGADRPLKEHDHCCDALRYATEQILEDNEVTGVSYDDP